LEEDSRELNYLEGGEVRRPPGMKPEAGAEVVEIDCDMTQTIDEDREEPREGGGEGGREVSKLVLVIVASFPPPLPPFYLHIPAKIKGHERANDDSDGGVVEAVEGGREGGRVFVMIYLHVPAEIKGHERANNNGDRSVVEEMQEGDLSKGAAEDEEVGVEVLKVLWRRGREGRREGGRKKRYEWVVCVG